MDTRSGSEARRRRAGLGALLALAVLAGTALRPGGPVALAGTPATAAAAAVPAGRPAPATRAAVAARARVPRRPGTVPAIRSGPAGSAPAVASQSVAGTTSTTQVRAAAPGPRPAPAGPATAPAGSGRRSAYRGAWGLFTPDFPGSLATVDALGAAVGRRPAYIMWYDHWAGPYSTFDAANFAAVAANGSTPIITWMSDDPTGATTITDRAIASGAYDSYVRSWANGLREFGRPVLLRLDHEMNGSWYGWSPGVNGNTAASFVAAWRHVHDVFAAAGATNVTFVWSPDIDYPGSAPLAPLYPGDAYVGMVAIDGYNWGPLDGHAWQTPQQLFASTVDQVRTMTGRPLILGEVGCTPVGGDKAAWMGQFFTYLEATPAIRGFVWFDADKETDWRVDSTAATLSAFVSAFHP